MSTNSVTKNSHASLHQELMAALYNRQAIQFSTVVIKDGVITKGVQVRDHFRNYDIFLGKFNTGETLELVGRCFADKITNLDVLPDLVFTSPRMVYFASPTLIALKEAGHNLSSDIGPAVDAINPLKGKNVVVITDSFYNGTEINAIVTYLNEKGAVIQAAIALVDYAERLSQDDPFSIALSLAARKVLPLSCMKVSDFLSFAPTKKVSEIFEGLKAYYNAWGAPDPKKAAGLVDRTIFSQEERDEFVKYSLGKNAIRLAQDLVLKGDVIVSGGFPLGETYFSPYKVDFNGFRDGEALTMVVERYVKAILGLKCEINVVCATSRENSGLAAAVVATLYKNGMNAAFTFCHESESKNVRVVNGINGPTKFKAVLVDADSMFTGRLVCESLSALQKNVEVVALITPFDRLEKVGKTCFSASQNMALAFGVKVISLSTVDDLIRNLPDDGTNVKEAIQINDLEWREPDLLEVDRLIKSYMSK